jgi:threonine synthase
MCCAVTAARKEGAEAVICASTGNTAASAAAYAARAGLRGAVIVPEGKIAAGKLAQALMHGARVIALRGNFDQALELVRELVRTHPISLVNSVNPYRLEGQKTAASSSWRSSGSSTRSASPSATRATSPPTGRASARPATPRAARLPGRGRRAARARPARGEARDRRERDPDRQSRPLGGGDGGDDGLAGHDRRRLGPEILEAYRLLASREGVFCEPASAASVAGLLKHGAGDARRIVCVLTGHGLKDPQTALEQSGSVVPCVPELAAVEEAVLS